ncbi:hypothetical protein P3T23_000838 [Paraburkholderia sp. GAS448]
MDFWRLCSVVFLTLNPEDGYLNESAFGAMCTMSVEYAANRPEVPNSNTYQFFSSASCRPWGLVQVFGATSGNESPGKRCLTTKCRG